MGVIQKKNFKLDLRHLIRTKVKKRFFCAMICQYKISNWRFILLRFALKPNLQFILLLLIIMSFHYFCSFFVLSKMFLFVLFLVRSPNRFGLIDNGRGD